MITNPEILAAAVKAWLAVEGPDDNPPQAILDEADAALDKVLVEQGLYKSGDSVYYERGAREHGVVHAFVNGSTIIQIDQDGNVERF